MIGEVFEEGGGLGDGAEFLVAEAPGGGAGRGGGGELLEDVVEVMVGVVAAGGVVVEHCEFNS